MSEKLITIIDDDLRMLLFWASVGVHLSKGGYCEDEIEHVLESYAEHLNFTLPYPPNFALERLPSFRGPEYIPPIRHEQPKEGKNEN